MIGGADRPHLEPVGARQLVAGAGRQAARAARGARRAARRSGSSTASAPLTATAAQPAAASVVERSVHVAPRRARRSRRGRRAPSRARGPGASATEPTCVRLRAARRSGARRCRSRRRGRRRPRAARSSPASSRTRRARRARAPRRGRASSVAERFGDAFGDAGGRSCEVGTTVCARSRSGAVSTATAFVNVPPTSTPIRIGAAHARDRLRGAAPPRDDAKTQAAPRT